MDMTGRQKKEHIQAWQNAASFDMWGNWQLWKWQECEIGGYRSGVDEDSSRLGHDTVSSGPLISGHRIWRHWALPKCRWLFTNRLGSPWRSNVLRMNASALPATRNSSVTERLRSQVAWLSWTPLLPRVCLCGTWWHIVRVAACWFETAGGGRENSWSQSVPRSPAQWTSVSAPLSESHNSWYPGLFNCIACQITASVGEQVVCC
jgi:hypothetical protein